MTPLDDLMQDSLFQKKWFSYVSSGKIFLFCIMVFQCSGNLFGFGQFEMMGATSLMQEDILMACTSFIGLTLAFPFCFD